MKTLYTFAIICIAICSYANDTLTRAEIYSFSVGDTLDYRFHYHSHYSYPGSESTYDTVFYERMVVSDIFYSVDSAIKYIERRYLYPSQQISDTIELSPPDGQEVVLDTSYIYSPDDTLVVAPLPTYLGQNVNLLRYFRAYLGYDTYFARGLGICLYRVYGGVHYSSYNDSTQLIYYSGANGILGTPYTEMPVVNSINNTITAKNESAVKLTVLADNTLYIQVTNDYKVPVQLQLYDMTGHVVLSVQIENTCRIVGLSGLAKGVYIWSATNGQHPIATGKVIWR
ncbi:MAG TPA: T9SS type A sorting domain-containing protein [Chitinophagales bacterium]|nr:T9SS type A sorting domain-containing protein [Chitinophagales bacterium]